MSKRLALLVIALAVCSALNAQQRGGSYVVLDKGRSFAAQVRADNTTYEIRDSFQVDSDFVLPQNCVLVFRGGVLTGRGSIEGRNTSIDAAASRIFADEITLKGSWCLDKAYCEWFGGSVAVKDNSKAIQRCLDAFRMLDLRAGSYEIGNTVKVVHDGTRISGVSASLSEIIKTKVEKGDVNAVIYLQNPKGKNIQHISMRDLKLSAASANVDYGIFTEGINSSDFRNLEIFKCRNGFYCKDETHGAVWNVVFDNIVFNCNTIRGFADIKPYGYEEGTTSGITCITVGGAGVRFNKCWARDCAVGYHLKGMNYCEMNNCGADNIHGTAYQIEYSSVTMNACGMESVITSAAVILYNSNCSVTGLVDYRIIAKQGKEAYRVKVDGGKATFTNCSFSEWAGNNPQSKLYGVTSNSAARVLMINTSQPTKINKFMALTNGAVLESL